VSRVATLWDEWVDEDWSADPLGSFGGASPTSAVTFPSTPLSAKVYIALGADLTALPSTWSWTDISNYVRFTAGVSTRQSKSTQKKSRLGRRSRRGDGVNGAEVDRS